MSAVLKQSQYEPFGAVPNDVPVNDHLDWLESEAIHIMREVVAETSNPALLFSGGKDSIVMLRLAEKAFRPDRFPFPLLAILALASSYVRQRGAARLMSLQLPPGAVQ